MAPPTSPTCPARAPGGPRQLLPLVRLLQGSLQAAAVHKLSHHQQQAALHSGWWEEGREGWIPLILPGHQTAPNRSEHWHLPIYQIPLAKSLHTLAAAVLSGRMWGWLAACRVFAQSCRAAGLKPAGGSTTCRAAECSTAGRVRAQLVQRLACVQSPEAAQACQSADLLPACLRHQVHAQRAEQYATPECLPLPYLDCHRPAAQPATVGHAMGPRPQLLQPLRAAGRKL